MRDQAITQMMIVESDSIDPKRKVQEAAFFNEDGTPWTPPPGEGDVVVDTSTDMDGESASDEKVPSQKAVKDFVASQISAPRGLEFALSIDEAVGFGAGFDPETDVLPGYIPVPAGQAILTYSLTDHEALSARAWTSGGPGEMMTDPVDILVIGNLLKYVVASQGTATNELPQLWWVVTDNGTTFKLTQTPLNPLQIATLADLLALYDFPDPPYVHAGSPPTVLGGANAGTGASVPCTPETDSWGEIGVVAGSGATAGELATLTFDAVWLRPAVTLTPKSPEAAALIAYWTPITSGADTVGFSLGVVGTPTNGVTYRWSYSVLGG